MKRWHSIVVAGVLLLAGFLAYRYRQELGLRSLGSLRTGRPRLLDSAHSAHLTWQTVDRSGDGFKVEMPAEAKEIQIPAYNETGGTDPVKMIYANPTADTNFSVAWADNPPVVRANGRSPNHVLDMAREEELARTQTTLINESNASANGAPARDIVAQNSGGGVIDSRLIYAGDRLYMLIAAFPSMGARREQDVVRFYNSFKYFPVASRNASTQPAAVQ